MSEFEGHYHPKVDHDAVMRVLNYWRARYADIVDEYPEETGIEFEAFATIAGEIGFSESRRVINYYLMKTKSPSFSDFLNKWPDYQESAQREKHDRMYRHPDPRK